VVSESCYLIKWPVSEFSESCYSIDWPSLSGLEGLQRAHLSNFHIEIAMPRAQLCSIHTIEERKERLVVGLFQLAVERKDN
jgi:hypothetical protein